MDTYRRQTKSLVTRFVKNQFPFESCIYSLDAALLRLTARIGALTVCEESQRLLVTYDESTSYFAFERVSRLSRHAETPCPSAAHEGLTSMVR